MLLCFFFRTLPEITDFKLGLNDIGNLWELVKSNAELFKPLFCQTHTILTKAIVDSLCQVVFSEQGSNLRAAEDETIYSWEVLLQDIQGIHYVDLFSSPLHLCTGELL